MRYRVCGADAVAGGVHQGWWAAHQLIRKAVYD
uniref:Uncharacterized protein n=1 Tax=Siphoviridae sp. ct7EW56 TaxID=2827562 RepID=A0A8S5LRM3_9CAUD|nr:MAG TPA: hypothetical protein [Siphoviridae sp. ct7EW56]